MDNVQREIEYNKITKNRKLILDSNYIHKIPHIINHDWLIELDLSNNLITQIDKDLPVNLKVLHMNCNRLETILIDDIYKFKNLTELYLEGNNIKYIDLKELVSLVILDLENNSLKKIVNFPPNIVEINLSNNHLDSLPEIPNSLVELNISNNFFKEMFDTKLIKNLNIAKNRITNIDISDHLEILIIDKNNIECFTFENLKSSKLEYLSLSDCNLDELDCFPDNLSKLILNNNNLKTICKLPESLIELDVSNNELTELPTLPANLKYINISFNFIKDINFKREGLTIIDDKNGVYPFDIFNDSNRENESSEENYFNEENKYKNNNSNLQYNTNEQDDLFNLGSFTNNSIFESTIPKHNFTYPSYFDTPNFNPIFNNLHNNNKLSKNNPNYISIDYTEEIII